MGVDCSMKCDFLLLRILSVFNLLKPVGFAVLLLGGVCSSSFAQQIIWERDGEGDSSRYGREILPLGDQNLDGFDDFAVQAFGVGPQGTDEGVWLDFFLGGNPPSTEPFMRIDTPPDGIWTGDIRTLDFNGDGFVDVMFTGNVKIYFGGPDMDTLPDVIWNGQRRDTETSKGTIGDFNGDGNWDLYRYDGIFGGGDSTEIFWGGVPFDTIPDLVMHSPTNLIERVAPRTFGDLNGDGIDDFITAVYGGNTTRMYIYHGSTSPDTLPDQEVPVMGEHVHIDIVPDLNGDGKEDLVLFGGGGPGSYNVFLGSDSLPSVPDFTLDTACDLRLDDARQYGPEIAGAGDFNNDGINDLLIVNPTCPNWGIGSLYLGYFWLNEQPVWTIWGRDAPYDLIGIRFAAGVGDINNDGFDDVAFGAFKTMDFDGWRGRAIVLAGRAMQVAIDKEPMEIPSELNVSVFPNPFNSTLSISLDVPLHQDVTLSLYDLLGREVDVIYRGRLSSQTISYVAPAAMASGVYFLRASAGEQSTLKKVVLLK